MSDQTFSSSKRVLDGYDRISEVLFGIIMVLTFTGSLSAAEAGRAEVRTMLFGALYLMSCLAERSRSLFTIRAVRNSGNPERAQHIIAASLPAPLALVVDKAELEVIRQRLAQLPEPPSQAQLHARDYLGGLAVFSLVFLSTFPVTIPFLCINRPILALRISHLIAITMLFLIGWAFGRCTARHPWVMGVLMVMVGLILAGVTMALGG